MEFAMINTCNLIFNRNFLPSRRADLTASAGLQLLDVKCHDIVAASRHLQQSQPVNGQISPIPRVILRPAAAGREDLRLPRLFESEK
jgi:hypothetical protein